MSKRLAVLAGAVLTAALALGAEPVTNGTALAYFAPENQLFFRLRYPAGGYREFQRDLNHAALMTGSGGWQAVISRGSVITVTGRGPKGPERYVFTGGRLTAWELPGETNALAYAAVRRAPDDAEPPYFFGSEQEAAWHRKTAMKAPKSAMELLGKKWVRSGRLRWPFENPNENGLLYASFALLAVWAMTSFRRRPAVVAGVVLFAAAFVPLVMTASRGAFLAFAVGLAPVGLVRFRALVRSRWAWIVAAAALALAAGWFATHESRLITRGFKGKSTWSNEMRLDMWRSAPMMMVDAPDGWEINAGKAYLDWYEALDMFSAPGSLINDHLSKMVRMGWTTRGLYAFGWFTLVAGLFFWGLKSKNETPAGLWAAYAVACWFNPLMINRWLLTAPAISLVPVLLDRPWRRWRPWAAGAAVGAVCAAAAIAVIVYLGKSSERPYGISVYTDGPRIFAGGGRAAPTWIVDDGLSLGGAFTCKEIRAALARAEEEQTVGYVRRVDDLPAKRVRRLVLGGMSGDAWLKAVSTDATLRSRLPQEVVFISPPFPPSAIPRPLFDHARVTYVTGEFNARYDREFDDPPGFVRIVPAMELYISDWMKYVLE